ncbi:unnamed protein product [Cylicocyclus nassatus]|uniref:Uncharacterized protein n=1 Tax=Cylicocyclus nassatus TaxID=53992 RepID=A0AA36GQV5_CYLNA|nr:unnamed protein product [Cylicocyclus nassatus]
MKFALSLMLAALCSVYTLNENQEGADDAMEPHSIKKRTLSYYLVQSKARKGSESWRNKERDNNSKGNKPRLRRVGNFNSGKDSSSTGRLIESPNAASEANALDNDKGEVQKTGRRAHNYIAHIHVNMDDRQTKELLSSLFRPLFKENKKIFGRKEEMEHKIPSFIRFPCSTDHKRFVKRREAADCVGAVAFTDKVCNEFLDCMLSKSSRNTDCQSRICENFNAMEKKACYHSLFPCD